MGVIGLTIILLESKVRMRRLQRIVGQVVREECGVWGPSTSFPTASTLLYQSES
jgi:hypothetical protein